MTRFSMILAFAVALAAVFAAPAYSQPALDEVGPLEVMLRVYPHENWTVMNDANGTPLAFQLIPVTNGVPDPGLSPELSAQLTQYQVQEMVVYTTSLTHDSHEAVATQIQMRLMIFPDDASAATYLADAYNNQVATNLGAEFDSQMAAIDPLPTFDHPLVGWTQLTDYVANSTEEFSGLASTVRYQSQIGRTVVSAQVTGPFVDFNFDLALGLISAQNDCLQTSPYCEGVTIMEPTSESWETTGAGLTYTGDGSSARWLYPVTEPVRVPEVSSSFTLPG